MDISDLPVIAAGIAQVQVNFARPTSQLTVPPGMFPLMTAASSPVFISDMMTQQKRCHRATNLTLCP
jgi:hypothetical protein